MAENITELDDHIGGLILMIIFTICWTVLSEIFFNNSDHRIVGISFGIIILYLIHSYLKFNKFNKSLPKKTIERNKKKDNWFYAVFALEGIAIFVGINILINMGKGSLINCYMALIVGLHFIPLAKIFDRKFDYYIGFWTTLIALIGMILIHNNKFDYKIVNALICMGCAISTIAYGLKKIKDGNLFLIKIRKVK